MAVRSQSWREQPWWLTHQICLLLLVKPPFIQVSLLPWYLTFGRVATDIKYETLSVVVGNISVSEIFHSNLIHLLPKLKYLVSTRRQSWWKKVLLMQKIKFRKDWSIRLMCLIHFLTDMACAFTKACCVHQGLLHRSLLRTHLFWQGRFVYKLP
jgi:hypothetical protein